MKIKKVFSLKKAIQLQEMGNRVLFTEDNYKNSKYKVFCINLYYKIREKLIKAQGLVL